MSKGVMELIASSRGNKQSLVLESTQTKSL